MKKKVITRIGSVKWWTAVIVIIIIAVGITVVFYRQKITLAMTKNSSRDQRQAIFLMNGQVYFGKIESQNDRYLVLREIYYLKSQSQLNADSEDKKIAIIKLGEEVHGPEDIMYINRDQILFYEQMRKNSKINEAIDKYVAGKK